MVEAEIVVTDVAAPEDGHPTVGDQELVVHTVVEALHLRQGFERPPRALVRPRVEEPDLDVRVGLEIGQPAFALDIEGVVDQDADPDAAFGGLDHMREQDHAGAVVVPEVILDVEVLIRRVNQRQAPGQSLTVGVEGGEARNSIAVLLCESSFVTGQSCRGSSLEGDALRLFVVCGQGRASRKGDQEDRHDTRGPTMSSVHGYRFLSIRSRVRV